MRVRCPFGQEELGAEADARHEVPDRFTTFEPLPAPLRRPGPLLGEGLLGPLGGVPCHTGLRISSSHVDHLVLAQPGQQGAAVWRARVIGDT